MCGYIFGKQTIQTDSIVIIGRLNIEIRMRWSSREYSIAIITKYFLVYMTRDLFSSPSLIVIGAPSLYIAEIIFWSKVISFSFVLNKKEKIARLKYHWSKLFVGKGLIAIYEKICYQSLNAYQRTVSRRENLAAILYTNVLSKNFWINFLKNNLLYE